MASSEMAKKIHIMPQSLHIHNFPISDDERGRKRMRLKLTRNEKFISPFLASLRLHSSTFFLWVTNLHSLYAFPLHVVLVSLHVIQWVRSEANYDNVTAFCACFILSSLNDAKIADLWSTKISSLSLAIIASTTTELKNSCEFP